MIPNGYTDLLARPVLAHVATLGPQGEPQTSPVWIDWDGERLRFSQTARQQKQRNLRRDPRVALSLVDPTNPYRYLEIRGRVVAIEADPERAFVDRMAQKYLGVERYPWHRAGDEHLVIVIAPLHTTALG